MVPSTRIVSLLAVLLPLCCSGVVKADEKEPAKKHAVIIGASSMNGLPELVEALSVANKTPMKVERGHYGPNDLKRLLSSEEAWDFVIMDAWQFKRGSTASPEFGDATAEFVRRFREHSPKCQIILFPWWLPQNSATNEDVMKVFHACVEAARPHGIQVATTGPAFQEARLARPDLQITVSRQDAHPGIHGGYINACSLMAILSGDSPVGLPATLKGPGQEEFRIEADDAKYLQELAWKVFQRELLHTNPRKADKD
jgi:hypothetical protein